MAYNRILTVQDISCLGQCSLTVALPILSACGQETCVLPTALLSTHTGGFGPVHKQDLTENFAPVIAHWKENKITFDAVYVGYLGKSEQIPWLKEIFASMVVTGGKRIVDPAMADHGRLYKGFDSRDVAAMKELCAAADVIIPNITEACLLTGTPYPDRIDSAFADALLEKLSTLCPCVILTGVGNTPEETGVAVCCDGSTWHYSQEKIPQSYSGTGDIFSSAFVGAWFYGKSMEQAVKIAADYTACCIQKTREAPAHSYGVKFEAAIPELIEMLRN